MLDLSHVSTRDLAEILARRDDLSKILVRDDGLIDPSLWSLRKSLGAVGCVDGVAVKRIDGVIHGTVIRRNTGKFSGKLALVGGVVALNESIEAALKRHWKVDLNYDVILPMGWSHPVCLRQYAPKVDGVNLPDFCEDFGKHSYASTHLVIIQNSESDLFMGVKVGGQEARGLEWYSSVTCPPTQEWAYDMRPTFLEMIKAAEAII